MGTDVIRRKWKSGAELARKIEAELESGRATRKALEVERRLAVCRRCDQFRGDSCAELELYPEGPTLCQLLTLADLHCWRWSIGYEKNPRKRRSFAATEEALDQLHTAGTHRSRDEHRAARRAGRARRRKVSARGPK